MLKQLVFLARFRFQILLRQKIGWLALGIGFFLVLVAGRVAQASFVNPSKIYWDFSLGLSFVFQAGIAIYLASQLYAQELERGTLHMILAGAFSRSAWPWGQGLGLCAALGVVNVLWLAFSSLYAICFISGNPFLIIAQAQFLLSLEIMVVVFMTLLLSLFLRPLLCLITSIVLVVFLHSLSSLQSIMTDSQSGAFVESRGLSVVLWLARLLPPLEWWDIRSLVSYLPSMPIVYVLKMLLIAALWVLVFGMSAQRMLEKKDL